MRRFLIRASSTVLGAGLLSLSALAAMEEPAELLAALDGDVDAITELCADGPAGLERVLDAHQLQSTPESDVQWRTLIDAVAGQRDALYGGLYWHTSLEAAQDHAAQTGKPILSLRLLGELTDEYSCANSRFFRTVLYSNPELTALIKERYVLHWSTERPVPVVTIDFGDGRTMRRTLTGNSAHYILDAQGRPLDVLPGLYSPSTFTERLLAADGLHDSLRGLSGERRAEQLSQWHAAALDDSSRRLAAALDSSESTPAAVRAWLSAGTLGGEGPKVRRAMNLSMGKMMVETPVLEVVLPDLEELERGAIEPSDAEWSRIAQGFDVTLPPVTRQLIAAERPLAAAAGDADLDSLIATFEQSIAEDTARNELTVHARIHAWFSQGEIDSFPQLNRRVYDDLFATPAADPWMGLLETGVYNGLRDGGLASTRD